MGRVGGSGHPQGAAVLTLLGALRAHGGDAGVQHIVDGRVAVEAALHVMLAVRLVTLLMATVLQTVPLQVLERGAAGETQLSLPGWDKVAPDSPKQTCGDGRILPSTAPSDTAQQGEMGLGVWGEPPNWHLCTPKHSIQPAAPHRLLPPLGTPRLPWASQTLRVKQDLK